MVFAIFLSVPSFCKTNIALVKGMSSVPYAFMFLEKSDGEPSYNFIRFSSVKDAALSLMEAKIDALILPVNVAALLYDFLDGEIICAAVTQNMDFYSVSSNSSLKNLSDLLGKKISVTKGGIGEGFISWIMEESALSMENGGGVMKIQWEENEAFSAAKLLSGEVDNAFLSEPAVSNVLKRSGFYISADFQEEFSAIKGRNRHLPKNVLVVRRSFCSEDIESLENLLASVKKSIESVNKNPSSAAFLCKRFDAVGEHSVLGKAIQRANFTFERAEDAKSGIYEVLELCNRVSHEKIAVPDGEFLLGY